MLDASKSFSPADLGKSKVERDRCLRWPSRKVLLALHILVAYGLIEAAVWTPVGVLNAICIGLAAIWILWVTIGGRFTAQQMGIAPSSTSGSAWILLGGLGLAAALPLLALVWRNNSGPAHVLPFSQAVIYAVWSLLQQFVLQSFFFARLESLLGGKWAVLVSALLFASVHLPSALLTFTSFVGGLFFCEMFRRYRNIFPLGLAHALLGLTLAASFSDMLLHHMRVGIGYVRFHP